MAAVARAHELDVEMLIVDDRSDDGTADAVARLADGPGLGNCAQRW